MLSFRDLSFRYKIPLRGIGLVLVTTTLLTLALVLRERQGRDHIDTQPWAASVDQGWCETRGKS